MGTIRPRRPRHVLTLENLEQKRLLAADLLVSISSDVREVSPWDEVVYSIIVANEGTTIAQQASVEVDFDPAFFYADWSRMDDELVFSGSGDIREVIDLAPGEIVEYSVAGVVSHELGEALESMARVAVHPDQSEQNTNNNMATDRVAAERLHQTPRLLGITDVCSPHSGRLGDDLFFVGWSGNEGDPCWRSGAQASSGPFLGHLWKTDGTFEGTELVKEIIPFSGVVENALPGDPQFTELDGVLFFRAVDANHGLELWRTDGTGQGTFMVRDINTEFVDQADFFNPNRTQSSWLDNLVRDGDRLRFTASNGIDGMQLWESDGTAEGTRLAQNQEPPQRPIKDPLPARFANDQFEVRTPDATWTVLDANQNDLPTGRLSSPRILVVRNDQLVFSQHWLWTDASGGALYALDLTTEVDAGGPYELQLDAASETQSFVTEVLNWQSTSRSLPRTPVSQLPAGLPPLPTSTDAVLGNTGEYLSLSGGQSIVVRFANEISGPDIQLSLRGSGEFEVHVQDLAGRFHVAGTSPSIDLSNLESKGPFQAVRVVATSRRDRVDLRSIRANIQSTQVVFTAESTNAIGLKYDWDLDGDGEYDDAVGKSVGLTTSDLATFGFDVPGEHTAVVRVSDGDNESFDIALLSVEPASLGLVGDIDGDGVVTFPDFLILSANFGRTEDATASEGDLDGDGAVAFSDYLVLSRNYGQFKHE